MKLFILTSNDVALAHLHGLVIEVFRSFVCCLISVGDGSQWARSSSC